MKKKESGGKRIASQGRSLVWVAPDLAQKRQIRVAAAMAGLPMGRFLLQAGLEAAQKILGKTEK